MNVFDVRVYGIRRRADRRRPFEVRWHAAGRARSRSFLTRRLADSYRAELVRAARQGLEFGPATGEPVLWATSPTPDTTWHQHAVGFVVMKWPHLAPHSRASIAEALATVTPELTRPIASRPPAQMLRAALYGHAFNPPRRHAPWTWPPARRSGGWSGPRCLSGSCGPSDRFRTQCRGSELRFGAVGRLRQDRGSCLSFSCTWLWSGSLAGWSCWGAARRPRTPRSSCCGTR